MWKSSDFYSGAGYARFLPTWLFCQCVRYRIMEQDKVFLRKLLPFALLVFLSMAKWGTGPQFYIGSSVVPVIWAIVLAAGVGSKPVKIAKTRPVLLVAMWSYSIYLSHSLVIHGVPRLLGQWVEVDLIYFLFSIILILIVGWALFFAVERSSILICDRLVPRRVAVVSLRPRGAALRQGSRAFLVRLGHLGPKPELLHRHRQEALDHRRLLDHSVGHLRLAGFRGSVRDAAGAGLHGATATGLSPLGR